MPTEGYELVIGLEVHIQLLTATKLFCGDSTGFGNPPNTQVSAVSLGHPGTLPRMNGAVIPMAIRLGLATGAAIAAYNAFARKHYFYPDLPKGYQISQHTVPVCSGGHITIGDKHVRINRIHIEEDAGKSLHSSGSDSLIDYNRAGTPLLELVTEPDISSGEEAAAFVSTLRQLVRHLGISDGDMEKGSLRCDVNLSVRPVGEKTLGTRVEIKNLNSTRFMRKAVACEAERLAGLHRAGLPILQETRGYDEATGNTYTIRQKEEAADYRYFPDPDLPPFLIDRATIEAVRAAMPPLASEEKQRLQTQYGLPEGDAARVLETPGLQLFFEKLCQRTGNPKAALNWVLGPLRTIMTAKDITPEEWGLQPEAIATLIGLIDSGKISYGIAVQQVLPQLAETPGLDIASFILQNNLLLLSGDSELDAHIAEVLQQHAQKITEYKKGKKGLISLFVGEVMRRTGGKGDAALITQKIIQKIKNS